MTTGWIGCRAIDCRIDECKRAGYLPGPLGLLHDCYYQRGDGDIHYIVEADGSALPNTSLDDEDIGRWLWFRPDVIPALLKHRDAQLKWYTGDTGGIRCAYGVLTHFGVNALGLICVYAYDVARLPRWQQRIWAGHNVTPEGGVAEELFASQWRVQPASTRAPEARFVEAWHHVNELFTAWCGTPLFRAHDAHDSILRSIHRFRTTDRNSPLSLAKDIARMTADAIDIGPLRSVATPPSGEVGIAQVSGKRAGDDHRRCASTVDVDGTRRHLRVAVGRCAPAQRHIGRSV